MTPPARPAASCWFVPRRVERPRVRLFCFPWAGGLATAFSGWRARLPEDVELRVAQLPGRGSRFGERPHDHLAPLLAELSAGIGPLLDGPYALFGHSLGAVIAFELARRLVDGGIRPPRHLFVSAARPPHLPGDATALHRLADDELLGELVALGGLPEAILRERELLTLVLPALRADLTALETWVSPAGPPLPIPVTALGGVDDAITPEELRGWRDVTAAPFALRLFRGGHFYLQAEEAGLVDFLGRALVA